MRNNSGQQGVKRAREGDVGRTDSSRRQKGQAAEYVGRNSGVVLPKGIALFQRFQTQNREYLNN